MENLDENDINNIFRLEEKDLFEINKIIYFRTSIVEKVEQGFISDSDFISLIERIIKYSKNNWKNLKFNDLDYIGYLGIVILLSKCSFIVKEKAIECANICIEADRYDYIRMFKRKVIDNIEPALVEQVHTNIRKYLKGENIIHEYRTKSKIKK